jgi:lactoylglutathione lyase
MDFALRHVGICVGDLDRSIRFYGEGLGFVVTERYDLEREMAEINGTARVTLQFLERGATRIELLAFAEPRPVGSPSAVRNQLGLTHLCFVVPDVHAATVHLVDCGGTLVVGSQPGADPPTAFVSDPDGTRIELIGT